MLNSIVEYFSGNERYKCGYCKSPNTNSSHGMWAHSLTVSDYQDLIDRGWRRSGKYCYKPTLDVTCCPMYTIRCRITEFKATKSQKKILKRMNKYLASKDEFEQPKDARKMSTGSSASDIAEEVCEGGEQFVECSKERQNIILDNVVNTNDNDTEKTANSTNEETPMKMDSPTPDLSKNENNTKVKQGVGADLTKAPCKKAKQLRRERKLEKLKEKGVDVTSLNIANKNQEKNIEDLINELPKDVQQRLEIKLVRTNPPSDEWLASAKETHEMYVKYQNIVHNDPPEKCTEPKFKDFLVISPLLEEYSANGPKCGYGSFHQQYWLDGKLLAVGVIDILPKCVSSVYFFYDPNYMHLTLGNYGALREIEFTRHLHATCPQLQYYYMGFYIHTCRKMRYKGNFHPSDLLCPETYQWAPIKECTPKLDISPYSRLNSDLDAIDDNYPRDSDIGYIPVLFKNRMMTYKVYLRKHLGKQKEYDSDVLEYAGLVGRSAAKKMILAR